MNRPLTALSLALLTFAAGPISASDGTDGPAFGRLVGLTGSPLTSRGMFVEFNALFGRF